MSIDGAGFPIVLTEIMLQLLFSSHDIRWGVFRISLAMTFLKPLLSYHDNTRSMVSHTTNRDHASGIATMSWQQEEHSFLQYLQRL